MTNLSEYLVKQPKLVLKYLKLLGTEKCLIAASFGDNSSFLTVILDINEKKNTITIDCGPKEYLNKELLNQGVVHCKANFSGIKVLFEGINVKKAVKSGETALSIKMPETLYWVQRRKCYRVRSPLSKNSFCSITFRDEEDNKTETVHFKLFDLSATGVSFLCDTIEQTEQLFTLSESNSCDLVLENFMTQAVTFSIRSKQALNQNKADKIQRIGCEFTNISSKSESVVLRYMQDIERILKRNQT